jgi:hypothetical protein
MTERAVRAADLRERPIAEFGGVQETVDALWQIGTPTAYNRSFVVAQYFDGMLGAIREMRRVLAPGGRAVLVIGTENRICGRAIPTAALIEDIAQSVGFDRELRFFHHLANRSSMRLRRGPTGGKMKTETVLVLHAT